MLKHFFTRQFLIFLFVGVTAATLHWFSRLLLSYLMPFHWAVAFAYIVGMTIAFILNRYFVFPLSTSTIAQQVRGFVVINLSFFPLVWLLAIALTSLLETWGFTRFNEELAHGLAISVPVVATFLMYKFIAFRESYNGR